MKPFANRSGEMMDAGEVEQLIKNGENLVLAGDNGVLSTLPSGNWIGGTIPYFMTTKGGLFSREKIYATRIPDFVRKATPKVYSLKTIHEVYLDAPKNGFSIIILPAFSAIHTSFALKSPSYKNFGNSPLIGWISGVSLENTKGDKPGVFDGQIGYNDNAVVLHVELPPGKTAKIKTLNIFKQGDGDRLNFPSDGFSASTAYVNDQRVDFADYIKKQKINTILALVGDFKGKMINTSIRKVNGKVEFYAPVFADIDYKLAEPIEDYIQSFEENIPEISDNAIFFSCNCILNYQYAGLEGKILKGFTGPMTFGEVAYQLLNQTMVYLVIE